MIHWEQGNLEEAQAKYEQSLAIDVELGDRSGFAISVFQLGQIHEEQGSYHEALEKYLTCLSFEEELGVPGAHMTRQTIARLREEMGEEAFAAALAELGVGARGG